MKKLLLFIFSFLAFLSSGFAQGVAPLFGDAEQFSVVGGSVANSGRTFVYAKVGTAPGAVTGFEPIIGGEASGGVNINNAAARAAKASAQAVYNELVSQNATRNLSGTPRLGNGFARETDDEETKQAATNGMVLGPGVYEFDADVTLSGRLVLDGGGNPNAVFIFKVGRDFVIEPGSVIGVQGQALPGNVFFQVSRNVVPGPTGSGNIGTQSVLQGNIVAQGNITLDEGTSLVGRLLGVSDNSVVRLNRNLVFLPSILVADVGISKTVSAAPYIIGGTVTYTITVRNNSPESATNVLVNEQLNSSLRFLDFAATRIDASGNATPHTSVFHDEVRGTFDIGVIGGRQSVVITLRATIIAAGTIPNTATVVANQPDPYPGNNTDTAPIIVPAISTDLAVVKTITSPGPHNVGTKITYTITARNNGPDNATGVFVTDRLPLNSLRNPQITVSAGTTFTYNDATGIFWNIGTLTPNATRTLTVTADIYAPGNITNTATIGNTEAEQVDQVPGNNSSTVTTPAEAVPLSDLSVNKVIVTPGPYALNQEVSYRLVVRNFGPDAATGVKLLDILPPALTFVGATMSQGSGSYNEQTRTYTHLIGALANNATATLDIVVRINTTGSILNNAVVSGDQVDPSQNNNPGDGKDTDNDGNPDTSDPDDDGDGIPDNDRDNEDEAEICVLPSAPLPITGPANVCFGPGQAPVAFSVPAISGATSYTFTLPEGWSNGNGGRTIVVPAGSGDPTISITPGTTAGSISVFATNACGNGPATSLRIITSTIPTQHGAITLTNTNALLCAGSTVTYHIAKVPDATSYTWTLPVGWSVISGAGTDTLITVAVGRTAGEVTVKATNACGSSDASSLAAPAPLPTPDQPSAVLDESSPCTGLVYSITATAGVNYTWTVSAGFEIVSGQGTNRISIKPTNDKVTSGTVSVTADQGGCSSNAAIYTIDVTKDDTNLYFPNAISPNGDGKNDTWKVTSIQNFPDNEVVLYNRWGNEVYRKKAYNNEWGAQGLEQGTYFYVLRIKECTGDKTYKGSVTVYR